MPLPAFLLIHMKLMLFTDFLQAHQSNLHPSDMFPLLNSTKKIFGGDANPSNNHRVRAGLRDLRERYIIRYLPEIPAVSPGQRSMRVRIWMKGNVMRCLSRITKKKHICMASLSIASEPLGFRPVVSSLFKAKGLRKSCQTHTRRSEWDREEGEFWREKAGEDEARLWCQTFHPS